MCDSFAETLPRCGRDAVSSLAGTTYPVCHSDTSAQLYLFFHPFFLYAAVPLSIHPWVVHHRYLPGCREPNVHTTCSTWPYYTDPFVANFISRRYGPHIYAIRSARWRQRQKIQLNDKTFFSTQLYLRDFVE